MAFTSPIIRITVAVDCYSTDLEYYHIYDRHKIYKGSEAMLHGRIGHNCNANYTLKKMLSSRRELK